MPVFWSNLNLGDEVGYTVEMASVKSDDLIAGICYNQAK